MTTPAVFTPAALADRWQCSERTIRNQLARGELTGFRLGGKLWRISLAEVIERESAWQTASNGADGTSEPIADNGPRSATATMDAANVIALARIEARQNGPSKG